jgi:hypothetical protein
MLLGAARRLVRKSILKMSSDLISPGEPNTFLCFGVLDELSQSRQSRRSPNDAAMQPDGHHLGRAVQTLLVQLIKGGDEVLGKVIRGDECLTSYVFVVVAIKRLRRSEAHARSERAVEKTLRKGRPRDPRPPCLQASEPWTVSQQHALSRSDSTSDTVLVRFVEGTTLTSGEGRRCNRRTSTREGCSPPGTLWRRGHASGDLPVNHQHQAWKELSLPTFVPTIP